MNQKKTAAKTGAAKGATKARTKTDSKTDSKTGTNSKAANTNKHPTSKSAQQAPEPRGRKKAASTKKKTTRRPKMPVATEAPPSGLERDHVLAAFGDDGSRVFKVRELSRLLGVSAEERSALRALLRALVEDGDLVALPGRRFGLTKDGALVEGRVQLTSKGYGWLLPEDESLHDAFLPPRECEGLINGDHVLCSMEMAPKGPVAHIRKMLARGRTTIMGTLRREGRALFVEPADNVLRSPLIIPTGPGGGADGIEAGMVVEALIVHFPTPVTSAAGRVLRSLGKEGELSVEVERILAENGIVRPFSPEADRQAESYGSQPSEADKAGREDLRDLPLCTIDGITAKDFDDAVYAEPEKDGWRLTVAIADVSHYVTEGSPLDVEAQARSTSLYYPGHCVPMLPEALSNGLCSLVPDVDRLTMCAQMHISPLGKISGARFFAGVIRSHQRLTYERVHQHFQESDAGDTSNAHELDAGVVESLIHLRAAADALREQRDRRGSLNFDLPESVVTLGADENPKAIVSLERNEAHKLIEELMIAANEAVACRFEDRGWPCVYRIHENPDPQKLERFMELITLLSTEMGTAGPVAGHRGGVPKTSRELTELLATFVGHSLRTALDSLLLRSMMQARYSADNVGHFGLGSRAYLHFTSPIRRYPDLLVHRLLRRHFANPKKRFAPGQVETEMENLEELAVTASNIERRALDAERAVVALYTTWFMRDRIGEMSDGVVTGCAEFGVFVRLTTHHVEGLCHISELGASDLVYDPLRMRLTGGRSGFSVGVGDRVVAEVASADLARRRVTLRLDKIIEQRGEEVEIFPPRSSPRDERRERASHGDQVLARLAAQRGNGPTNGAKGEAREQHRGGRGRKGAGKPSGQGTSGQGTSGQGTSGQRTSRGGRKRR